MSAQLRSPLLPVTSLKELTSFKRTSAPVKAAEESGFVSADHASEEAFSQLQAER